MSTDVSGMIECRPGARLWGPDDEDSVWEVGIDLFLLNRGNAYDGLACLSESGTTSASAPVIGDFVRALLAHGSHRAVLPKCANCSSTKKLTSLRTDGLRVCQPCDHASRAASLSCIECSRPVAAPEPVTRSAGTAGGSPPETQSP
ncbi:hypothetical protein ACFW9N_19095 [Streptomyces sp. NPDC059496]|uniref:hypothetical protein n=1 Tax=Streptomyces sp. NPDC059496 TaxID=3346851 RepID=UPI0036AE71C2